MCRKTILPITLMFMMLVPLVPATTMTYDLVDALQTEPLSNTILSLTYNDEHKEYSLEDLLDFDQITGNGGRIKSSGSVSGPYTYTGVLISNLAQEFTSIPSEYGVMAIADDGYTITYTSDEIAGETMVYDSEGNELGLGGVSMILATSEDGDTDYSGAYRIVFVNDNEPITDASLWAKYVIELEFFEGSSDTTAPEITIVNPVEGYFHFSGIPLFETSTDLIGGTMGFGGFRVRPVQIEITDDVDGPEGITATLYADDIKERDMVYNSENELFEGKWIGPALGTFTMKIVAEDSSGNIAEASMTVWYFCFVPE